jgi:hypothetical protein
MGNLNIPKVRLSRKNPKEICSRELKKIKPLVVAADRKQAMAKYNITYVTVCRYLNGNVGNPILGINLVNFFASQINGRAEAATNLTKRIA